MAARKCSRCGFVLLLQLSVTLGACCGAMQINWTGATGHVVGRQHRLCCACLRAVHATCRIDRSIDNSEWARNGDFVPTRLEAQCDAVNLISSAKMQQHPESGVGTPLGRLVRTSIRMLNYYIASRRSRSNMTHAHARTGVMTLAGKGVEVLVSPSGDMAKILSCVHGIPPARAHARTPTATRAHAGACTASSHLARRTSRRDCRCMCVRARA